MGSWNTHVSELYGTHLPTLTEGYRSCPVGSKVVNINGYGQDYVRRFQATCDDKNRTLLGPWGPILEGIRSSSSCDDGMRGWYITHGSYIGSMSFTCLGTNNSFGSPSIALGNTKDFRTRSMTVLSINQSIIGFRVYCDNFGINALRIEYADFNATDPCYNSLGEETGKCPTTKDFLAIIWGFLTVMSAFVLIGLVVGFMRRMRKKIEFRNYDALLPLK